jgi:hypothetical protein
MNFKFSRRSGTLESVVMTNLERGSGKRATSEVRWNAQGQGGPLEPRYRVKKVQLVSPMSGNEKRRQRMMRHIYPVLYECIAHPSLFDSFSANPFKENRRPDRNQA